MNYIDRIKNGGVVGCGGAGFPAHVKAASKVEYVIANGAECEPLLHKDLELMIYEPEAVVSGLIQWLVSTGSKKALLGVKKKNEEHLFGIKKAAENTGIELRWSGDYYPTGDEYVLVYETTKRLIPPQGIPLDVGIVVNNVETLRNAYMASEGIPVTDKYVSIVGAVKNPCTFKVPIGLSYAEAIAAAGGATVSEFAVFVSGIMMGKLETDMSQPITKTCAGLVVLPTNHRLVKRKSLTESSMHRIGKSACDQCSYCTEFCPRYLLGYDVQPHKVMRSLGFTVTGEAIWNQYAQLCCACGLCTLYACPEELYPKEACDKAKADLRDKGIKWSGQKELRVHPLIHGRHVPLKQLVKKLGIADYDAPAHFVDIKFSPKLVRIPLSQHIGLSAIPVVEVGKEVKSGQLIGDIPAGKLGAKIHSSIDGVVTKIDAEIVIAKI
ncbi:MAG: 4Fe-4S dicluster domain-containing protein [Bacteroidetes bacterium]|nr:4Fe-4S dicluster domain-containing protein [Bacteroidota bacterium]MBU1423298.1 4Fe-4S dicluster domain-containing protein [Bacteroidota bacterium]MBU2471486.1 4Fe-4S dicluster domain-containing protein [Bacteroidota bacterium]MBU2636191.1 4Fe-4S dicluster domain-containing protein [Bacteroidota bacterium]